MLSNIPAAIVNREHARLNLQNQIGGEYESQNVVTEIRGREKPGGVVLIGAHLDSWDLGTRRRRQLRQRRPGPGCRTRLPGAWPGARLASAPVWFAASQNAVREELPSS